MAILKWTPDKTQGANGSVPCGDAGDPIALLVLANHLSTVKTDTNQKFVPA
jgi:hypothetical protein